MSAKLSLVGDGGRSEPWRRLLPSAAERAKLVRHPFLAGGWGRFSSDAYGAPGSELSRQTAMFRYFPRANQLDDGPRQLYSGFEIKLAFYHRIGESIPTAVLIAALILEGYDVACRGKTVSVWLSLKSERHDTLKAIQQAAIAVMNAGLVNVPGGCQTHG
jgi:hypothetical protein